MDLVTASPQHLTDDLPDIAFDYPGLNFAGVDYALTVDAQGTSCSRRPTWPRSVFARRRGSFLVGAIAVLPAVKAPRFVGV